jgi:hypothetical protein
MGIISTNIDDLLDETTEIADEVQSFKLNQIEIDNLLEKTINW